MQERLQKIIARAGIASRRHAELLISSGQVLVNGQVVTELGTKADPAADRIEAAGRVIGETEKPVYIALNKPPEVMSTLADPEGRKTLRNLLRGFPIRVYPVGNLEYAASGLIFLTNDGDLAAEMIKQWSNLEQVYHVKVKGMLSIAELDRLGKEIGVKIQTLRQPDATRGHAANYWYEVIMRDSKKEELRNILFKVMHPLEKMKRVGLGPLTVEGIPRGRYRMLDKGEIEALKSGKFTESAKPLDVKHATPESLERENRARILKKNFKPYAKPAHTHEHDDERPKRGDGSYSARPGQGQGRDGAFSLRPGQGKRDGAYSSRPAHGKRKDGAYTPQSEHGNRPPRRGAHDRHGGPARSGGPSRGGKPGRSGAPGRKFPSKHNNKFEPRG